MKMIQSVGWSIRGTRRTRWCIAALKVTYQFQISRRCNSYSECATLGAATAVTVNCSFMWLVLHE